MTSPEQWPARHDTDGSFMYRQGPSVVGDGIAVDLEWTPEHGVRCLMGDDYMSPTDLREVRDQLDVMCGIFHE